MKKLGLFVMALLSTVASFAIDPHGARVDSEGGAGAGLFVLAVLVGLGFFLYAYFANPNTQNNIQSTKKDIYDQWVERGKARRKAEEEAGLKGCIWTIIIVGTFILLAYLSNN